MTTRLLTRPAANATRFILTVTSKYGTFAETYNEIGDARIRGLAIYNSPRLGVSFVIHDEHGNGYERHNDWW